MIHLHVLASGSRGNAAIIENARTGEGILIDCGLCKRDFLSRCADVGFDPVNLQAILVTHDHSDHTKGLGVVLRGLSRLGVHVPLFTSFPIRERSTAVDEVIATGLVHFEPLVDDMRINAAGLTVLPFRTSHDAAESFGFRFEDDEDALGFMTDTGIVTPEAHQALQQVRLLAIESNHDEPMLWEGPYPYHLKQRVASERGHLSNDQAADELGRLLHEALEHVVAMHVSQNNNTYRRAQEALQATVDNMGFSAQVSVAYQDRPISIQ